jgi:hypothetical protein
LVKQSATVSWSRITIEGFVIVVSILLAFGIDAMWDARLDRARERAYLELLASDLRSSLANIERFGSVADSLDPAVARLVRAYYEPDLPSADSVVAWLNRFTANLVVQPRLGTAQTLVESGDLALIRNDSLKTAIRDYLSDVTYFDERQREGMTLVYERNRALAPFVAFLDVRLIMTAAAARDSAAAADPLFPYPEGSLRSIPTVEVEEIVRGSEVHAILGHILQAKTLNRQWRTLMRSRSEELLERVEAALDL